MNPLKLQLLGAPQLLRGVDGNQSKDRSTLTASTPGEGSVYKPVHIARRKASALLAYLAMAETRVPRTTLAPLLWPNADRQTAFANMRRDLSAVKKTIGTDWIDADRYSIHLNLGASFSLDVDQFRRLLSECTQHGHAHDVPCQQCLPLLDEAATLYRGDFMQGFSLPDSPAYDDWQYFEAEQLHADAISVLSRLVRGWREQNDFEAALRYARRWLTLAPDNEPVHRELMRLYAICGNQAAALRQYEECMRILAAELDVAPDAETDQLRENILAGRITSWQPDASAEVIESIRFVPPSPLDEPAYKPLHNLPRFSQPLIGRQKELEEARNLLTSESACRLLTFVGPPGIGKSRLAIETGLRVQQAFQDGIYIVYLAPLRSADQIVQAVVDALPLQLVDHSDPKTQLLNYLRAKQTLLILDNYEHLLSTNRSPGQVQTSESESLLLDILSVTPQIRLLVTSQARVQLQEEWVRDLNGLSYPPIDDLAHQPGGLTLQLLSEKYSAIQLFLENARRVRADGVQSETDLAAAVAICQMVEGLPLGIELATSWLRFMSCADIADGLKHDLAFVDSTLHDVPERHRSLSALFEYSWRHLTELERDAFSKLSIFEGGFTQEAAANVAGAPLRLVAALVDRSIVRNVKSGRFELHNILKQFARRKLQNTGNNLAMTQNEHCDYYAHFLQVREDQLHQIQRRDVFAEVANEADNLRAAWDWAVKHQKLEQIAASLEGLHYFYYGQGWIEEGEVAFGRAATALQPSLATKDERKLPLIFARLVSRQGRFGYRLGRYSQARKNLQKSLGIVTDPSMDADPDAKNVRAFCLYYLSAVERADGDYESAEALCQESLDVYRELDDQMGVASALKLLAIAAGSTGRYGDASALLNEALDLFRALDDQHGVANTLNDLGVVADREDSFDEAERLYEQCLTMRREIDDAWGIAASLNNLGYLTTRRGNHARAQQLLQESLLFYRELGDQYQIANVLSNLGSALSARGEFIGAERCFGEAVEKAWNMGAIPLVLESLIGMAGVLASDDLDAQGYALEILHLVNGHPNIDTLMKRSIVELLDTLQPEYNVNGDLASSEEALASLVDRVIADFA